MRPDTGSSLDDIAWASDLIQSALAGISLELFMEDWQKQAAVERQFIIIGEALIRIRTHEPSVLDLIPDSGSIIRFRNFLVHGYDAAEPDIVYDLAGAPLTELRPIIEHILSGHAGG